LKRFNTRYYERYSNLKTICVVCIILHVTGYESRQENAVSMAGVGGNHWIMPAVASSLTS